MKQSPNDPKIYQPITLSNGLPVLLVHNEDTEKSAAALAVNVGHFSDPKDRQGLAHFLEHMLFLGTKKYPNGSEYQKFISQFGGSHNAWTATEHTCFYFDIHHSHFESALDRFSEFFISPLLSKEFVQKERQNIDAEFKLKLKDDIRRLYDVHKETINQQHPFSQFSVGTIDTLNDREHACIRDEVERFFNCHYRAAYMTLALEGPQTIKELTQLAEQKFSAIKVADKPQAAITQPLYLKKHLGIKIDVKPVKNDRKLIVSFAMPSIDSFYRHKPESVLSYLLGHEGKGSILSLLKQQQWAMALTAGSGVNGSNFKDFNISMSLTELGEQHIDDIIEIIFKYISLLKEAPLAEYYYEEKQAIAELSFLFHEKVTPLDSVCQLVVNMQHYPVEDYIFGDFVMDGLCQTSIDKLLSYLSSDNMRIIHVSQQNQLSNARYFDQTSFWYQVPYHVTKIAQKKLTHWQKYSLNLSTKQPLCLPARNPYIIANPQVFYNENTHLLPELIYDASGINIWYKQDITFKVPKGHIYVGIDSPVTVASPENIAMTRLFVDLYSDRVVEKNYDAELAGMHYHLYAHQGGITLQLSGVSANQPALLTRLLKSLKDCEITNQRFLLIKQQLKEHWRNSNTSKSISQLFSKLSSAMQPNNPSSKVLVAALTRVNFSQFEQFVEQMFKQITIDVLIHGNWHYCHAEEIANIVKQAFQPHFSDQYEVKCPVIDITGQGEIVMPLTLADHDHASILYYPFAEKNLKSIASALMISQLLSPLFFQQMRTEKQYGYLVGVGYIPINRYPGIAFYIQSPDTHAFELADAIDDFIHHCLTHIKVMVDQEWQQIKQGLAGQLQENDTSLRVRSQRFWMSICNKDINFDHKDLLIAAILSLSLDDIKSCIELQLFKSNKPDRITLISLKNKQDIDNKQYLSAKIKSIADFAKIKARKY